MPSASPNAAPTAFRVAPRAPRPMPTVLVVDDFPQVASLLARILRRTKGMDARITAETNGSRALELAHAQPFDLVVCDYRLRETDGVSVLAAARRRNPHGLRMLVTGREEIAVPLARLQEAAIDAYLQKPLQEEELPTLFQALLRQDADTLRRVRDRARLLEGLAARRGVLTLSY